MAELQFPNFLAAQQAGYQYGNRLMENNRTLQQQNALRQLAPQVISGDPDAYARAAVISPEAAQKYDEAGTAPLKKFQGLVNYMEQAKATKNPAAINAALREAAPLITRLTGKPAPTEWTPEMDAGWEQLKAKVAMAGQTGETPTGFRQFQMTAQAAGLVPGTPEYQQAANIALGREGRASSAGFGFELVEGADGRKRLQRQNPRTGAIEIYDETTGDFLQVGGAPAASAAPASDAQVPAASMMTSGGVPVQIPPNEMEAYQRALEADARGEQFNIQIPPGGQPTVRTGANPSLVVGRRPEDEAAAVEAAKTQVQLGAMPAQLQMETQDAIRRAGGVTAAQESARTTAEVAAQQAKRTRDAANTLQLLGEAERLLPNATGGRLAAMGDQGAAFFGKSTEGAQANASLKLIAAKLIANVPRFEGPQSNIDVQFYREAAGDLANQDLPVQTRLAAAQQMRRLQEKYASPQQGASGAASPPAERRARNPQTGETLVLRNGQWVPER